MTLLTLLLHLDDGRVATVPLTSEQLVHFYAEAAFYDIKLGSAEMATLMLRFVNEGNVKSLNHIIGGRQWTLGSGRRLPLA